MDGSVRGVAGTYVVLGLFVACFALYALALDPATFQQLQLQFIKESGPHPPEQGQMNCTATAAEAMGVRADAVRLLLLAASQVLLGMVGVAGTSRIGTICAQIVSISVALSLPDVFTGVVHLAFGRCHGHGLYYQELIAGYVGVVVPFALLFIFGIIVTISGDV